MEVNVSIAGILMCCDESLCALNIGNGYRIEKCALDDLTFKQKITNVRGQLETDYLNSRIIDGDKIFFMCIKKVEVIQINEPSFNKNVIRITDKDCMCEKELSDYMDKEMEYLNEINNLLRIYKKGNIGFYDVFFHYTFTVMGFINNTIDNCSHNQTRNTIDDTKFYLRDSEIDECNNFIIKYKGNPYRIMKNSIDEFSWGMEQIDIPTGFEQYTTALEMTLLPQNQPGKKQMLANRVSTLLGDSDSDIQQIHQKMMAYYSYRSESLHDGDGTNITAIELEALQNITRNVLGKCLEWCSNEYSVNHAITWIEVKEKIMNTLISQIQTLKSRGVLQ